MVSRGRKEGRKKRKGAVSARDQVDVPRYRCSCGPRRMLVLMEMDVFPPLKIMRERIRSVYVEKWGGSHVLCSYLPALDTLLLRRCLGHNI